MGPSTVFVSHSWAGDFLRTFRALEESFAHSAGKTSLPTEKSAAGHQGGQLSGGGAANRPGGTRRAALALPRAPQRGPEPARGVRGGRHGSAAPEAQIGQDEVIVWMDLFSTGLADSGPDSLTAAVHGLPAALSAVAHTVAVLDPWNAPRALLCASSILEIALSARLAAQGACRLGFVVPSDHRSEFVAAVLEGDECCNEARRFVSQIELSASKLSKPVDPAVVALGLRSFSGGRGDSAVTEVISSNLRRWISASAKAEVALRVERGLGRPWDDVIATNFLRILLDQAWCVCGGVAAQVVA